MIECRVCLPGSDDHIVCYLPSIPEINSSFTIWDYSKEKVVYQSYQVDSVDWSIELRGETMFSEYVMIFLENFEEGEAPKGP